MEAYLARLIDQASAAPFATDLLEVDQALWGSFWQGDVIAPGYALPAIELALLRAVRLDSAWPKETSLAEFLADLHATVQHPQAGVWTLPAAGELCVIFAAPFSVKRSNIERCNVQRLTFNVLTVVWYCETTRQLHAGYRAAVGSLNFPGAVEQRALDVLGASHLKSTHPPAWLEKTVEHDETIVGQPSAVGGHSLAARLDAGILRIRLRGYSQGSQILE